MQQDDLERLYRHAKAGSELAARFGDPGDGDLAARLAAYRQAAEALARAAAQRLEQASEEDADETGDAASDPQAVALAARLAEDAGVALDDELVLLAREEIDALDGDTEAAYNRLRARP